MPVPPPTYTLKDTAPRAAAEPAEVSARPVPIEVEDDGLDRVLRLGGALPGQEAVVLTGEAA